MKIYRLSLCFLLCGILISSLTGCSNKAANSKPELIAVTSSSNSSQNTNSYPEVEKSQFTLSSSLKLEKEIKTNLYTLKIPSSWEWTNTSLTNTPMIYFNYKGEENYYGGILESEYNTAQGEKMPNIDSLITFILPNHSQIIKTSKLNGLAAEAYLLDVDLSQPAASNDDTVTHWTYVILLDKKRSDSTHFAAYTLFLNKAYASTEDTVKIADSFRLN